MKRTCPECTHPDEDPRTWCDCRSDESCAGPCQRLAHSPERCPRLAPYPPADAWVPVPLQWQHVLPGDIFVGKDGNLWAVAQCEPSQGGLIAVQVTQRTQVMNTYADPDDVVSVLVTVSERDAGEVCREVLGARLVERRTNAPR